MIRHFEKKGWTGTKFEMFFNHKKRYKGFEWDGDETRWPKDDVYFKLYKRLLAQATPRNTPVQMIIRHDASWRMHEQFQSLNGVVDLWVCGGGILSWFPWAPKMLHDRGEHRLVLRRHARGLGADHPHRRLSRCRPGSGRSTATAAG